MATVNQSKLRFLPTDTQLVDEKADWKGEEVRAVYKPSDSPCFHKVICQGGIIYPNGKLRRCHAFLLEVSAYSFNNRGKVRIKCRKCDEIVEIEKPLSMNIRRTRLYRHGEEGDKTDYSSWYEIRCPKIIALNEKERECNSLLFKALAADHHCIHGVRSEIKCHQCRSLVQFMW